MESENTNPQAETIPVLIVGGSLVGLSAALFLSARGVANIVVERHVGSAPHPRAIGYTPRTMELYQPLGITARLPQIPSSFRLRRARIESLAGKWIVETAWTPRSDQTLTRAYSPFPGAAIAQDLLEPILRETAVARGSDLRPGVELLGFTQDGDGVTARLRERAGGREYAIRARYLIAADGAKSAVREALGIARKGRGAIRTVRSVLFRAPLEEYLASGISQFEITQPGLSAFLTTYQDGRWVLMFTDDVERDQDQLAEAIHQAIGRRDLKIEILTTGRWELTALIAERYAAGRVFLAGDAAHTLPPTRGGFGANTGIEDVHNLAWKLEAVLGGRADAQLLETYNSERQPIGWLRHQQTFARPDYAADAQGIAASEPIFDDVAMELGQLYRSAAIVGAGAELPPARRPDEWQGQPGTRAPHAWVARGGERISTLELFQGWVVLAADGAWGPLVTRAGAELGLDVKFVHIGADIIPDDKDQLQTAMGLGTGGASLIRPDGYVAWRTREWPAEAQPAFERALAQASCSRRGLLRERLR
jgi:2-polyprenyl-6-methoxyphenol hydroxylase-like FAD-dependent oxidoreductase